MKYKVNGIKGAVRYYLMDWDPAFDALEMIFRMRRTVAEQLPGYGSAKESYEQIRGWVIKLGDNIGNSVYNKDIPFVSDFVGEAFHSSDREESGDSSNLASVSGAFVNGFVGTGALGTVDGIGGMIADPYGAAEGIVSMLANREEAYVMIKEAAMKAVDENLINGGWEDRSRVAGAVVFEVFSAIYSAGALSAAKAGDKAGDAGKTSKLLNKVSDAGGGIKRGISKGARKTLGGKAAKEAAEEADDILGDLARRMSGPGGDNLDDYSMVKGWLEDQGKSLELMDEGGVNIHKVEGAVDDVLEGGEVLKRGSGAGKSGRITLTNAEDLKMSQTVQNHMNDIIKKGPNVGQLSRPYIDSDGTTLLLKEIMESANPVPDTILQSGLRWDVSGTFRGATGTWELVVDTSTNTVVHFNFVAN